MILLQSSCVPRAKCKSALRSGLQGLLPGSSGGFSQGAAVSLTSQAGARFGSLLICCILLYFLILSQFSAMPHAKCKSTLTPLHAPSPNPPPRPPPPSFLFSPSARHPNPFGPRETTLYKGSAEWAEPFFSALTADPPVSFRSRLGQLSARASTN